MVEINEVGDATALKDGLHRLNYRVKDSRDAWSQTVTSYFLKRTNVPTTTNTLTTLQYWWDDDFANSTQKSVSGSGIVEINELGDATALKDGLHRLNYRVKDSRDMWSQTITSYFLKRTNVPTGTNMVATLEYWWDNDYATHIQKAVSQDTLVMVDEAGGISALSDGIHRLTYRVKDNRNQWSSAETYAFIKYGENFPEPEIQMNDGKIYQFFDAKLTWTEANDLCQRLGGTLAIAETASDSLFIASVMKDHSGVNYYWLGNANNYYARNTGRDNLECGSLSGNQDYPSSGTIGFILEKELEGVGSLEVTLPDLASNGDYKNMTLELSKDSLQRFSLTVTEKLKYTFNGIPNGMYQLTLKNKYGAILGNISGIIIKNVRETATFTSLLPVYLVKLNIDGNPNLSGQPSVKWYDENETLLNAGDSITGVAAGMKLKYQIGLNDAWGKVYVLPAAQNYTVIAGNNTIKYALQEIPAITIEGKVKAEDGGMISGAVITVSQLLNGKYSKMTTGKTDNNGQFSMQVSNDSSTIIVSYPNYINQTLVRSNFNEATDLGVISLSPVKGATITLNLTYTPSVAVGDTPATGNWYSDYQNVDYALFNVTQGKTIDNPVIQYPDIVLLDSTGINDEIRITASSRTKAFDPVQSLVKLDTLLRATAQLNIMQRGSIQAAYTESANSQNVGILYDSAGRWVNQYVYSGGTLQTGDLPDGSYQLVSMASSSLLNTLSNLSAFASIGLVQNTDYALQTVTVKNGTITAVTIPSIPVLNESKWYYTGNNTSFSVNKSSVTAGNYLTLRSTIDFKEENRTKVSNVKLVVELPEYCEFVSSSVMVGNAISSTYTFADNRLTLPLANYSDIVKFCVIPVQGGDYAPNAFVQFDLDGKTILQPIGTALFKVENMSFTVPSLTAQATIPVSGTTTANSEIKVYDGDMLIGQTTASATGNWSLQCDLYKPYALSYHDIHAEAQTPQGLTILSDVREVTHDITAIEVSKVTMYNTAHTAANLDLYEYATVFDFLNPSTISPIYWYWPSYPDFTFKIEFTNNDPKIVTYVTLNVYTRSGNVILLPAVYDEYNQIWVANAKFDTNNLPINVGVDFVNQNCIIDISDESSQIDIANNLKSASTNGTKGVTFETLYKTTMSALNSCISCCDGDGFLSAQKARINSLKVGNQGAMVLSFASNVITPTNRGELIQSLAINGFENLFPNDGISDIHNALLGALKDAWNYMDQAGCTPPNNPPSPTGGAAPVGPDAPADPSQDPSGYVYEAVPSNRLQGVTASVYYESEEENMYGECIKKTVLWDAENYEQVNPQITDEFGQYSWFVPQGLWQVKYEKEGYETVYSDWLPVPPPQLDINVAMVQASQPEVQAVKGYESGITIEFNKFMLPSTLGNDSIYVTRNDVPVPGTIEFLNAEANPQNSEESFVSKVRFVPETPFIAGEEVVLTVKQDVKSYAGITMAEDFVQRVVIQREVKSLIVPAVLNLSINEKALLEVSALPKEASAGKKINVRSVSSSIATVGSEAVLNATGAATIEVTGELPGSTVIYVSVDGTDLKEEITVNVTIPQPIEQVAIPTASISSGSTVEKNTMVTLSSNTTGSTIYYTLDGSEPSAASGSEYTQPIVITDNVTIRAIAVKEGMSNSEIAVFEYHVNETGIPDVKVSSQYRMIISPNPVQAGKPCIIKFDIPDDALKDFHISLYSISGEKVYENYRLTPVVEIKGLRQGSYIIRLSDTNNRNYQTRKLIVIN